MLPLIGSLPDMTATNARYVELQRTYKAKAEADLVVFRQAVERILTGAPVCVCVCAMCVFV